MTLLCALFCITQAFSVYGDVSGDTSAPGALIANNSGSDTYDDSSSSSSSSSSSGTSNSHDTYDTATSTNPFILPASTYVTPVATHGQDVAVVLPVVNMFKYNITDVIITPVISAKTDEFPFEIDATGFTQKIDYLLGETVDPNPASRARSVGWTFKTRENVKTGYYKLDYSITYTNPACVIESCTISTFVKTVGTEESGTTDGDEDKKEDEKKSTPRVIVTGFTTEPEKVQAGEVFKLNLTVQNTSNRTSVNNMEMVLTGTVTGKDEASSYAAFLPTSGANSFYLSSIPAGGTAQLSMDFTAKADLEQKPYVMDIKMKYEDSEANPYEGEASVSIPVHQISKFDTSSVEVQPSSITVGEQANIMFSIYNTGKTKLYNVSVSVNAPSLEPTMAYVGGIDSGGTGNVDMMVTGTSATMDEGDVDCLISYEDESGNVTLSEKTISLYVSDYVEEDFGEGEFMDEEMEEEEGMSPAVRNGLIAGGAGILLILGLIVFLKIRNKRKRLSEERELARFLEEEELARVQGSDQDSDQKVRDKGPGTGPVPASGQMGENAVYEENGAPAGKANEDVGHTGELPARGKAGQALSDEISPSQESRDTSAAPDQGSPVGGRTSAGDDRSSVDKGGKTQRESEKKGRKGRNGGDNENGGMK
ncbi:MAG: hypothetical protein K5989_06905 [Lachnospiraceae bacterium]|nr:hypothetical protein [Lachnospiraceae bacterium]